MDSATQTAIPGVRWDAVRSPSPSEGGDLQALRGQNRVSVLQLLQGAPEGVSTSDIHHGTALSRPTVRMALDDLITRGLVSQAPLGPSTARGGRPGRRFAIDSQLGVVAGAVIGLEHVDVAIADVHGKVIDRASHPRDDSQPIRDHVAELLRSLLKDNRLPTTATRFLTIGVIGIVEPGGRIHRSGDFAETSEARYFQRLDEEFGCTVLVDNDANLAAMAEFANLADNAVTDMIGLHADVAIGCGIVLNSHLHRGFAGAAGELGFHPLLGWRDSHERLQQVAAEHGTNVAHLFRAAGIGEQWATEPVEDFAATVAPGVLALVLALNPQVIVIGGAICQAGEAFRRTIRARVQESCPAAPEILYSELGSDCILLGALGESVNALWESLRTRAYGDPDTAESDTVPAGRAHSG